MHAKLDARSRRCKESPQERTVILQNIKLEANINERLLLITFRYSQDSELLIGLNKLACASTRVIHRLPEIRWNFCFSIQIGQRANFFLCGLENIWFSMLVHYIPLRTIYCSRDVDDVTHVHFGGALPPFVESWGGSSPPPLPPPLSTVACTVMQQLYS